MRFIVASLEVDGGGSGGGADLDGSVAVARHLREVESIECRKRGRERRIAREHDDAMAILEIGRAHV